MESRPDLWSDGTLDAGLTEAPQKLLIKLGVAVNYMQRREAGGCGRRTGAAGKGNANFEKSQWLKQTRLNHSDFSTVSESCDFFFVSPMTQGYYHRQGNDKMTCLDRTGARYSRFPPLVFWGDTGSQHFQLR